MEKIIPRARTFRRLKVLTRREARVLHAVADTIFPSDGADMPTVAEAEVVEYLDDLLAHLRFKERLLIRSLLGLLEVQMLAFNGFSPKLFSQASFEERTANLAGWEHSRIFQRRLVFMAIRTLLLWAYADSQETERKMGYVPGTTRTAERQAAAQAAAEASLRVARGESLRPAEGAHPAEGVRSAESTDGTKSTHSLESQSQDGGREPTPQGAAGSYDASAPRTAQGSAK